MHEIAEASSRAFSQFVLSAAGFSEVSNRRQFCVDWNMVEPAVVQVFHAICRVFFKTELDIHISDEMITEVITYVHLLDLAVFVFALYKHVFEELVKVFLHLQISHAALVEGSGLPGAWVGHLRITVKRG
jgi:hypothetical protein